MARTNATNFAGGLQFPYATAATDLFKKEDLQVLAQAVDQHVHDGAGKGLTVSGVAAGSITTTMIAANAVSQTGFATGATSGPTTTSASYVDLPDMAVTLTTVGGELLVRCVAVLRNTNVGVDSSLALSLDAAAEVGAMVFLQATANYETPISTQWRFTGVAAGAHTVKARWRTGANTVTASGTARSLFVEELKR